MSSYARSPSLSTSRIASPYTGRGRKVKAVANVAPNKTQMTVISWENVLVPLDWMAAYLGLGLTDASIEMAVMRCQSSQDLLYSLAMIEDQIMGLLMQSMQLIDGPLVIVSEYTTMYVERVCSLFFPRLTAGLRSSTTGIYVVGTPNTQLTTLEMKQWKVNLLHTAILERLFARIPEDVATKLLGRSASGRIKVVALCASENDMTAASAVRLIAPNAIIKRIKVQGAGATFSHSSQTPVSLDDFYDQLQGLSRFVGQSAN
ncbi:unnamed protein product [Phytophthora lilii]|uniref:Unnamed protein product n=1 Tax=Phytophthora lilii TaxID=2077276 RepID=A0A9W6WYS1_9STRA|nr:unnamed protein product [Phytophthora lilii]